MMVNKRVLSEETKKKISQKMKGRKQNEETKRKISIAKKGKVLSEEHRKKLSLAKIGKRHTEESKKKMSISHKANPVKSMLGKKVSDETKKKMSVFMKNNFYINKKTIRVRIDNVCYMSLNDAAKDHNTSPSVVKHRCKSLNFYGWEFINEDNINPISLKRGVNDIINKC